ncbi:MAG: AsmA family protein [Acidobacteriaceae bacterium]
MMIAADSQPARRRLTPTRLWISAVIVLLLIGFLLPPWINMNRFQRRITASISGSLGRPVHLDHVGLQLLPLPGFTLDNFVVGEAPGFGSEPMMRASSVTATLHISSLWRGRLEFSSISLDEPSVNLVRNAQGDWNIESILLQAAHTPSAPTAQKRAGSVPRFPYIEATNARVNIKFGYEKLPFSFTDAEFALWQANPQQWGIRLKATPTRTDMDVNDAGTVKVEGSLRRASTLSEVPLALKAEWYDAQLGGVTRIVLGQDAGWRGSLDTTVQINGTANDALISARTQLDSIRRAEFVPDDSLDLDARCTAHGADNLHTLDNIHCSLPLGDGALALTGAITGLRRVVHPALQLTLNQIPAQQLIVALHHASNEISPALMAKGTVDGKFEYGPITPDGPTVWQGQATMPTLLVSAPELATPLLMKNLVLLTSGTQMPKTGKVQSAKKKRTQQASPPVAAGLTLEPVALAMGGAAPTMLSGDFDTQGYAFHLKGSAAVKHLLLLDLALHFMGTSMRRIEPSGTADLNMTLHGPWERPLAVDGSVQSTVLDGTLSLHNAVWNYPPLHGPVEIASANAVFAPEAIVWSNIAATYAAMPVAGNLSIPVHCETAGTCGIRFSLTTATLDAARLQAALTRVNQKKEFFQEILDLGHSASTAWPTMQGVLHAGTFTLGNLTMQNAIAQLTLEGKEAKLESLTAKMLNGNLQASGTLEMTGSTPAYALDISLQQVHMNAAAALFREKWGGGTANAHCTLKLQGADNAALLASTQGKCSWDWSNGALGSFSPATKGTGRLKQLAAFHDWQGEAQIENQTITLGSSKADGSKVVSGSIGFDRALHLTWNADTAPKRIEGTLQRPRLAAVTQTASGKQELP